MPPPIPAAQVGAHAIKLQTYTADTMTLDVRGGSFEISDPDSLWDGQNLHDLYAKAYTPWEWHAPIMERARELGLICFSSPFDETAVDFLLELDVPAFKIASFENNHLPLIEKAAATGKPLIISTGMASLGELDDTVRTAREALGEVRYGPTEIEFKSLVFRRFIYVAQDIMEGESFTPNNLKIISPGDGLPPSHLSLFLGKKAKKKLFRGTLFAFKTIILKLYSLG